MLLYLRPIVWKGMGLSFKKFAVYVWQSMGFSFQKRNVNPALNILLSAGPPALGSWNVHNQATNFSVLKREPHTLPYEKPFECHQRIR